jgi:ubiquinone/menaquinone biosynthesis C-methylase UbiE
MTVDSVKELVRQHWDHRAADFDKEASHGLLTAGQSQAWHDLMGRVAGLHPLDVLDVGCGTGFLSLILAELGHRVMGIDLAPSMLEMARAKAKARGLNIDFRSADAEAPDLPHATIDLIVERHVLWTLPDPKAALDNWRRLLRKGGRLVLIEGHRVGLQPREEYADIYRELPLFGGRPENDITALVASRNFSRVRAEPLMNAELWLEPPAHPRYLVTADA